MSRQVAVDEAVQVAARILPSGEVVVKAFDWQGSRHDVTAHGRRWEERTEGGRLRCFLVQTQNLSSFELRWDPAEDQWRLYQAWLVNLV